MSRIVDDSNRQEYRDLPCTREAIDAWLGVSFPPYPDEWYADKNNRLDGKETGHLSYRSGQMVWVPREKKERSIPRVITRDQLVPLLEVILKATGLHEKSWNSNESKYTRTPVSCFTEACGGDEAVGYLLYLFNHWFEEIADREFGVTTDDAKTKDEVSS